MALDPRNRVEISRFLSVGQDRKTGEGIIRLQGRRGRIVTLRVHPSQLRKLADGVTALAVAREAGASDTRCAKPTPAAILKATD